MMPCCLLSRVVCLPFIIGPRKNRCNSPFHIAHPSLIAELADTFSHNFRRPSFPSVRLPMLVCADAEQCSANPRQLLDDSHQPLRPYMLSRIDSFAAKDALSRHGGLDRGKETKDQEGCGNSHPKARRLLQESEESRHAFSVQPFEEVTSQTAPSRLRGDGAAS